MQIRRRYALGHLERIGGTPQDSLSEEKWVDIFAVYYILQPWMLQAFANRLLENTGDDEFDDLGERANRLDFDAALWSSAPPEALYNFLNNETFNVGTGGVLPRLACANSDHIGLWGRPQDRPA